MDDLAKVDTILFDKTGTLTKGKPQVSDIKVFSNATEDDVLQRVATAEQISEHQLGKTVVQAAHDKGLTLGARGSREVIKGARAVAQVSKQTLATGNRKRMEEHKNLMSEQTEDIKRKKEK